MNSQRDSRLTVVGDFNNLQSAEIAAGMLRSNGVPCEIENVTISSVIPMTDTWTPLRLYVPESYAARARALLNQSKI